VQRRIRRVGHINPNRASTSIKAAISNTPRALQSQRSFQLLHEKRWACGASPPDRALLISFPSLANALGAPESESDFCRDVRMDRGTRILISITNLNTSPDAAPKQ